MAGGMVPAAGEKEREDARDEGPQGGRRAAGGEAGDQARRRRRIGRSPDRSSGHGAPGHRRDRESEQVRFPPPAPRDGGEGEIAEVAGAARPSSTAVGALPV